jgi:hypothetical protein
LSSLPLWISAACASNPSVKVLNSLVWHCNT